MHSLIPGMKFETTKHSGTLTVAKKISRGYWGSIVCVETEPATFNMVGEILSTRPITIDWYGDEPVTAK